MKSISTNYFTQLLTSRLGQFMIAVCTAYASTAYAQNTNATLPEQETAKTATLNSVSTTSRNAGVVGINSQLKTQTTFNCDDNKSYLFQGDGGALTLDSKTSVYEFNILKGIIKEVKSQLIPNSLNPDNHTAVNNVGYNRKDNYMWGYRRGTNQLVRIANNWTIQLFTISGLPSNIPFNSGDIDENGVMYLYYGEEDGSPSTIKRVDLTTKALLSDITLKLPASSNRTIRFMIDMAFNPIDKQLYGVDGSDDNSGNNNYECHLYRINPTTGAATDLGNVGISNHYPFGAAYFDNDGTLFLSQNLTGKIYKIKSVSTGAHAAAFVRNGPKTNDNDGARCADSPILPNISGSVFDDANGLVDNTVNGTPVSSLTANTFSVNLVKGGKVVATTTLTNGEYSFDNLSANTSYTLTLSNTPGTVGSAPPSTALINDVLNTGENIGSGTGSDGTPNGIIVVNVTDVDVDDVNFGVERLPTADNITAANQANPGGTVKVVVPTLTGSDLEDGTYDGTVADKNTIVIKSLPSNGKLYYNNTAVTNGQVITNYDPSKLTLDPDNGLITVTFTYAERDAANKDSSPATVTMPFTLLPDLTPIIYARPSTVHGKTDITVVVDVIELKNAATSGLITVKVTKDPLAPLTFTSGDILVGGRTVKNSVWTFDGTTDPAYYVFTTTATVSASGMLSFGLQGTLNPSGTKGNLTLSSVIDGGSGGEVRVNNNTDADKIDYFQQ